MTVERLITFVATKYPALAAPKAVLRAARALLPKSIREPYLADGDSSTEGTSFVLTIDGVAIAVVALPFQLPLATLGTAIGNEYIWKEAGDVFLASKGHFLISVLNPEMDPRERLKQARVLTIVTSAVLSTSKATGVFWQAADYVIKPNHFLDDAKSVAHDDFASPLWFSFRFYPGSSDPDSDLIVCQSRGLTSFLGREIECGPYAMTPAAIAEKVVVTARYMATAGAVFADGHTFSYSGSSKPDARIHFDWSAVGGENRPIFQLRLLDKEAVQ